jgi:adenine-specific DNA-methyltransferase
VEALVHDDTRVNIPTADAYEFVDEQAAKVETLRYPRDPSLDPQLVWKGKDEQDASDLVVDAPPIFIQEKIDPRVLIENLRDTARAGEQEPELTLFDSFDGLEGWQTVEFYQHAANWSNRMILGDSLARHGLAGGEGEPPRPGADDLRGPAVRDQIRVQLAGVDPEARRQGRQR